MILPLLVSGCALDDGEKPPAAGPDTADTAPPVDSGETGDSADTAPPDSAADTGPFDADGDGSVDAEDCGPTDPWTYPGAEEWCDPVDHDCDGDPLPEGVCGKAQRAEALDGATRLWVEGGSYPFVSSPQFVGDLDGVPGEELIVTVTEPDVSSYAVALSHPLPAGDPELTSAIGTWVHLAPGGPSRGWVPLGDFDGDGAADLAAVHAGYDDQGWARILPGPSSSWGPGSVEDRAAYTWNQMRPLEYTDERELVVGDGFGWDYGGGDLNGDGLGDLVVAVPEGDEVSALVMFGRASGLAAEMDPWAETASVRTEAAWTELAVVGDVDGDGLDDLALQRDGLTVVSGADLTPGAWEDWLALGKRVAPAATGSCAELSLYTVPRPGDWDADGYADVLVPCGTTRADTTLGFVPGATLAAAPADAPLDGLVTGSWDLAVMEWGAVADEHAGDIDGDGVPDVIVRVATEYEIEPGEYSVSGFVVPLLSGDGPPAPYTDVLARGWGLGSDVFAPQATATLGTAGDFDGDGLGDLALGLHGNPETAREVLVVPNWGIPWDDATLF